MPLNTASTAIGFTRKLEEESAQFYEEMSRRYVKASDIFSSFTKENRKYIVQIERAYYGVISDALEVCFAFNIDEDKYSFQSTFPDKTNYSDLLQRAIDIEDKIIRFYTDAVEQSKSLMADVSRAFMLVAKKRGNRIMKLRSLLSEESLDGQGY